VLRGLAAGGARDPPALRSAAVLALGAFVKDEALLRDTFAPHISALAPR
jgi:hypothetical protein